MCKYIFETLLSVREIDEVIAYCSDEALLDYLPEKVSFLKRSEELDGNMVKGAQIYSAFLNDVDADVYDFGSRNVTFYKKRFDK